MRQALAAISTENAAFQGALTALRAGNLQEAELRFQAVLQAQPNHIAALNLLGIVLTKRSRFADAEKYLRLALRQQPKSDTTLYNYGIVLKALHRPNEALERFTQALAINSSVAETWNNRGTVFNELNRPDEAIADFERAIKLNPRYAEACYNSGSSFTKLRRFNEALSDFDRALALKPDFAEAWLGRANVFKELGQYDDALSAYDRALALKADLAEAWLGIGNVFAEFKRYEDAVAAYDRAAALKSDLNYVAGARLHARLNLCDWADLETDIGKLLSNMREQNVLNFPFTLLSIASSAADQLHCARRYVQNQPTFPRIWRGEAYPHDRIRVAYLSADLGEHPIGYLTVGMFEQHDRSRFEVTGISFGPDQNSPLRERIKAAFERFVDVRDNGDQQIAELLRELEVDITVDLMGHTQNARPGIFARRPAPIQVNYLGYSGTMGTDYIDYILADPTVIPEDQCEFYAEQVIWLPDCYLPNDDRRIISDRTPTRSEYGLPENAFVYCCFNNSYKLTPEIFHIWIGLLNSTSASVLWLSETNPTAYANLRHEMERRGVSADRLIFAPKIPEVADHLARQRLADLFLDTLPYNAHTTASDALWAGVPVLTCLGATFPGRVAASLLKAIGLPELVTNSLSEYEALALKIATEPALLAALKAKLARNRNTTPLFDTARTTRQNEAAYTMMWEQYQRRKTPRRVSGEFKPIRIK
jgi:protein O-GlcNAc transferase